VTSERNTIKVTGKQAWMPLLLLLPAFLYYAVFWAWPVMSGVKESFTDNAGRFTLQNFKLMWESELFVQALVYTGIFTVVSVAIELVLALGLAVLFNRNFKGVKLLMFIAMIPMAIPPTAVAILWKTGLMQLGWVNTVLMGIGLIPEPVSYLSYAGLQALFMIIAIDAWTVTPSVMIILVAGLSGISKEYKEAAYTFGANRWTVLKDITLPILKPSIVTAVILRMIAAMQVWAVAVMVLGFSRTPFLVERVAFYVDVVSGRPEASRLAFTISFTTTVLVFAVTMVYFKLSRRNAAERSLR